MKKFILILMMTAILFTGQVFAFIFGNDSCLVYNSCNPGGERAVGTSMGQLIVDGGGYFLDSHSRMLMLLNRLEVSGVSGPDYSELRNIVNAAIESMENAEATYDTLISTAKGTPYNPEVLSKLMSFDYPGYLEKNGLKREAFLKVAAYLSKGDVTGVYVLLKSDMSDILERLHTIKMSIDSGLFPEKSMLWRINQDYGETMLVGQYLAEVFNNL